MTEAELQGDGDHEELMASKEWSIQEIAWLLAIGFGTVWAATTIAGMVFGPGFHHEMQLWAASGFFVCYCNPRGSCGKGNAFADLQGKYGEVDFRDLM